MVIAGTTNTQPDPCLHPGPAYPLRGCPAALVLAIERFKGAVRGTGVGEENRGHSKLFLRLV